MSAEIKNPAGAGAEPGGMREERNHHSTMNGGFQELFDIPLCSGRGQYHSEKNKKHPQKYIQITLREIEVMLANPQSCIKSCAQWVIPSSLLTRVHQAQREQGTFYMLWADLDWEDDKGILAFDEICDRGGSALRADFWAYTSASATEAKPKTRILCPLKTPLAGCDYVLFQKILNDRLEMAGLPPDRATQRAGQVCYLPNRGEFYRYCRSGTNFLNPSDWGDDLNIERQRLRTEINTRAERAEISRAKAIERIQSGCSDPTASRCSCLNKRKPELETTPIS